VEIRLSPGEKLMLIMLCEIQEHLKMKSETDTKMIKDAIFKGNLWGLERGMPGVFHDSEPSEQKVNETVNILVMWQRLEESFANLQQADKEWLEKNAAPFGKDVKFHGFGGNEESEYIGITRFHLDHLRSFEFLKGRDLDAHMPTLAAHRRMLKVFEPILQQMSNRDFTAQQIADILKAWIAPK
jgi:uncharacterized protein YfbU (UPF0304 family)